MLKHVPAFLSILTVACAQFFGPHGPGIGHHDPHFGPRSHFDGPPLDRGIYGGPFSGPTGYGGPPFSGLIHSPVYQGPKYYGGFTSHNLLGSGYAGYKSKASVKSKVVEEEPVEEEEVIVEEEIEEIDPFDIGLPFYRKKAKVLKPAKVPEEKKAAKAKPKGAIDHGEDGLSYYTGIKRFGSIPGGYHGYPYSGSYGAIPY